MVKRFRIGALILFLCPGLLFLWLAFPGIRKNLFGNERYATSGTQTERLIHTPEQGEIKEGKLYVYDKSGQLLYSLDGGERFEVLTGDSLMVSEIRNTEILYRETSIRWRHPEGSFPKLKTVTVKVRDEKASTETSPEVYTWYTDDPGSFPVVHIAAKEGDLFSRENGIMVYGVSANNDDGFQKDWWYQSANFANRGSDWGRNVMFQYFENGVLKVQQECEMRISGNATRYFPQKSFKLFPLDDEKRKTKLAYPFWGEDGNKKAKSLLFRQSGNDNNKTMFADLMMHQLASDSKVLIQNGFPVSVFINGNYWGIYNFRERIDAYWIAKKEDVKSKDVTILYCEVYGDRTILKDGDEEVKREFDRLIENLPEAGELSEEEYDQIKDKISVKSFIDYIVFETFYANQDWLHNNTTWYKAKDKKWKWLLNDLDFSLAYPGEDNLNANLFDKLAGSDAITAKLFNTLMRAPKFKKKFKKRAAEIVAENFSDEHIDETFTRLKTKYQKEIEKHIRRWRFIDSIDQWEKDCQKNVTFLRERRTLFLKQVDSL